MCKFDSKSWLMDIIYFKTPENHVYLTQFGWLIDIVYN